MWRLYLSILQISQEHNFLFADFVFKLYLHSALNHVILNFCQRPSSVTESARRGEQMLPEELTMNVVDVVMGVTL